MSRHGRHGWDRMRGRIWSSASSRRNTALAGSRPHHCRRLRYETLEDRRLLTITVDTDSDVVDGILTPGNYSLREAVANAAEAETINISVTTPIQLTNDGHDGEIAITKSLTINGPNTGMLTIRAHEGTVAPGDGEHDHRDRNKSPPGPPGALHDGSILTISYPLIALGRFTDRRQRSASSRPSC